jgi:hypothetical protein
MFQTTVVKKLKKTSFMFNNFSENRPTAIYEIRCKKYGTAAQATDDSTHDTAKKR